MLNIKNKTKQKAGCIRLNQDDWISCRWSTNVLEAL